MVLASFWTESPRKIHDVEDVRFNSTLINPIAAFTVPECYPLVIWFSGGGPSGLDGIGVELAELSRATSKPFVLVAPFRSSSCWVLDDSQPPLDCVEGSLSASEVAKYCHWIQSLAGAEGIDHTSVSLFGGSAGAYAVSEIIASGTCELYCVGLAALHGHGRPDRVGLDEQCKSRFVKISANWTAYINRIGNHLRGPSILIGVHSEEDTFCPWRYAREIYKVFDNCREIQRLLPTRLVRVHPCTKHISHNYGPQAMELFLQHAFGDDEGTARMLASYPSFSPPTSLPLSCGPVCSSQADVTSVVPPGTFRVCQRSRSPRQALHVAPALVHLETDHVATVQLFGRLTLVGGMQIFYVAHSEPEWEELWTSAKLIGKCTPIANLEYLDGADDSDLCQTVGDALSQMGREFAAQHFMCTKVGMFVAVGFGGTTKKRQRTSRVAAAVCCELQAKTPVQEFDRYPLLQRFIEQVRSSCNFNVFEA